MLRWALIFLLIAGAASVLGYGRVASGAMAVGQFLLIVFFGSLIGATVSVLIQRWLSQRIRRRRTSTTHLRDG